MASIAPAAGVAEENLDETMDQQPTNNGQNNHDQAFAATLTSKLEKIIPDSYSPGVTPSKGSQKGDYQDLPPPPQRWSSNAQPDAQHEMQSSAPAEHMVAAGALEALKTELTVANEKLQNILAQQSRDDKELLETRVILKRLDDKKYVLEKEISEYSKKLENAQRDFLVVEADRRAAMATVDAYLDRITDAKRGIDTFRADVSRLTTALSAFDARKPSAARGAGDYRLDDDSRSNWSQNRDREHRIHDGESSQGQRDDDVVIPSGMIPCVEFNKGNPCNEPGHIHVCGYCRSTSHTFQQCDQKGCICVYYNRGQCDQSRCVRLNICIFCLSNHPVLECPSVTPEIRAELDEFCMNWNSMSFCHAPHCRRRHECIYCHEKHCSLDCQHLLESFLTNPDLEDVYQKYRRRIISVRNDHQDYRRSGPGRREPDQLRDKNHSSSNRRAEHWQDRRDNDRPNNNYNNNNNNDRKRRHTEEFAESRDPERGPPGGYDREQRADYRDRETERASLNRHDNREHESDDRNSYNRGGTSGTPNRRDYGGPQQQHQQQGGYNSRQERDDHRHYNNVPAPPPPPPPPPPPQGGGRYENPSKRVKTYADDERDSRPAPHFERRNNIREDDRMADGGGYARRDPVIPPPQSHSNAGSSSYRNQWDGHASTLPPPPTSGGGSRGEPMMDYRGSRAQPLPMANHHRERDQRDDNRYRTTSSPLPPPPPPAGRREYADDRRGRDDHHAPPPREGGGDDDRVNIRDRIGQRVVGNPASGGSGGGDKGGDRTDKSKPCFAFNDTGKCPHGERCWYRHACTRCDSYGHGASQCPDRR